jgi:hypothetical protein
MAKTSAPATQQQLIMSPGKEKENHYSLVAGKNYKLVEAYKTLIIDAHMHIQSNNVAPLPLQWGLIKTMAVKGLVKDPQIFKTILNLTRDVNQVLRIASFFLLAVPTTKINSMTIVRQQAALAGIQLTSKLNEILGQLEKIYPEDLTSEVLHKKDRQ